LLRCTVVNLRRPGTAFAVCAVLAALTGPRTAFARDGAADCSPEDWFCDDGEDTGRAPELAPQPELPDEAPGAESAPNAPLGPAAAQPPPPGMLPEKMHLASAAADRDREELEDAAPPPWSVNLRLEGIALGSGQHHRDSGLGGLGVSLRYALRPSVALDLGLDSFGGSDYNGHDRSETSLSLSGLWFLNPDGAIRTYVLLGLNASAAQVNVAGEDQDWTYFGAQAGLGLDFRVSARVSLSVDAIGFLRGRVDSRASREPEFSDGLGNLSNTSGGGLFRGGVSLYW
jgi:hypothetical protein